MLRDQLCRTCQGRLDALLWAVGRHPNCHPAGPIDTDAFDRLTRYLALRLGAEIINPNEEEN